MDQQLIDLMATTTDSASTELRFLDDAGSQVEVHTPDGPRQHILKPLGELYGTGVGAATVDPQDDDYTPLFHGIERSIVDYDQNCRALTDADVSLALDRLGANPEGDPGGDALARHIQRDLRLLLSVNDYSRHDVRAAIRKITRSVARHTRLAGPSGYLTFIRQYVRP